MTARFQLGVHMATGVFCAVVAAHQLQRADELGVGTAVVMSLVAIALAVGNFTTVGGSIAAIVRDELAARR